MTKRQLCLKATCIHLDEQLTLATGELQRELRDRLEDGAFAFEDASDETGDLSPTTVVSLRKLLLGGRLGMAPALLWHALKRTAVVVYLDHTSHARGWIDNVLKALVRDGRFFVQARRSDIPLTIERGV